MQKVIYARDNHEKRHLLIDVLLSQGVEGQVFFSRSSDSLSLPSQCVSLSDSLGLASTPWESSHSED